MSWLDKILLGSNPHIPIVAGQVYVVPGDQPGSPLPTIGVLPSFDPARYPSTITTRLQVVADDTVVCVLRDSQGRAVATATGTQTVQATLTKDTYTLTANGRVLFARLLIEVS